MTILNDRKKQKTSFGTMSIKKQNNIEKNEVFSLFLKKI